MRLVYLLLSPTFGMHQYTADLANRMAEQGHEVHLVTTQHAPQDRYHPAIQRHLQTNTTNTGLSAEFFALHQPLRVYQTVKKINPHLIHITGPHLWNNLLMGRWQRDGYKILHTLHDLDPHLGRSFGSLLRIWNRQIIHTSNHILVHAEQYRQRIAAQGQPNVTHTPLLHLFLSHAATPNTPPTVHYQPFALFFGRIETYKGITTLLHAYQQLSNPPFTLIIAGQGEIGRQWKHPLPQGVELRNHRIPDQEALTLFRHCSLLILPYHDGTQSALIPAAYYFSKPVIATQVGAFIEYVPPEIGWLIPPRNSDALAETLHNAFATPNQLSQRGHQARAWYDEQRKQEFDQLYSLYHRIGAYTHGSPSPFL